MKLVNSQDLLNEIDKAFPIDKMNYFFIPFIIIITLLFSYLSIVEARRNDDFFPKSFTTKIVEIEHRDNGFHYKLDTNWYLIKHPIVEHIAVGDSILKEPQSLYLLIKNTFEVKGEGEVSKNIIFQKVDL